MACAGDVPTLETLAALTCCDSTCPQPAAAAARLGQVMRDKLIEHHTCIRRHGEDMPEIRERRWSQPSR